MTSHQFADRLRLERIDRDIFTGHCHSGIPLKAYGGQIAAQSLMAAGSTVDDPERRVHSLHGYFLRPGGTKDSITYLVDRPRDGRTFTTRFVRAVQQGETIFMMTASFAVDDPGPEHQFEAPVAPSPDEMPPVAFLGLLDMSREDAQGLDYPESSLIDLRTEDFDEVALRERGRYEQVAWVRVRESLAGLDNAHPGLVQACALTYLSDLTMVPTAVSPHMEERDELQLASIDHAVWFHRPVQADRWLLFTQDTPVAGSGHGLARGLFFDESGVLVASVVQESLMRTLRGTKGSGAPPAR